MDENILTTREKRFYALKSASGAPACQSSKLGPPPERFSPYQAGLTDSDKIDVTSFAGGGIRVDWPLDGPNIAPDEFESADGYTAIRSDLATLRRSNEQSTKSRLRAAWTLSNAETDWQFMTTLTYPVKSRPASYEETARHRKQFLRRAMKAFPGTHWAWILEFTGKKAAHYHVFWGGEIAKAMEASPTETFTGKRFDGVQRDRIVIRGDIDKRIVSWWTNQADDGTKAFRDFQNGGITELILNPDGAGRYVAKEAAKRSQKHGPFLVGQWFGLSKSVRPKLIRRTQMTVGDYVAIYGPVMMRHLF